MAEALAPFVWGQGGSKDSVSRRRQLAEALMKGGMDYSPVQHWTQGLARLAQALVGGYEAGQADKQEKANNDSFANSLSAALGGSSSAPSVAAATPSAPSLAGGSAGARTMAMPNISPDIKTGIADAATALGISPVDLATAISYETGGTFNPTQAGPTTKWGQHRGLIQFGEPQAKQYGVDWSNPAGSQLGANGAIVAYLRDRGVKPGMGMMDIYSTINAGAPGLYDRSDATAGGAPGTVADKVNSQMAGHRARAERMFADLPAAGASPVAMETGASGFAVPPAPAPTMTGATFNAIQSGQPLDPVFQSEGITQPWMGTALQPAAQPAPQVAQTPLPPPRPTDLVMPQADLPAPGAVPAVGQMPQPIAPEIDPNSPDAGVRAQIAANAQAPSSSPFLGIAQALSSSTPPPAPASQSVQSVAQALAPQAATGAPAAPSNPVAALAIALARSGDRDGAVKLASSLLAPVNGIKMDDRLVDPRTGRVIADFTGANGGRSNEFGLNPVYGTDKDGKTVIMQIGKRGDAVATKLPEGVSLASGVERIDLGTSYGLMDKRTGQMVGTLPKDVAGTEQAKIQGKTAGERVAEAPQAELTYKSAVGTLDRLASEAKALRDHKGLKGITGWQSMFPNAAGGDAANAQAKLETLKSQIGFGVLQAMREASKTGGALGSVSDAEGKRLENNLAALAQSQSLEEFQKNLGQIIDYAETSKGRLGDAYRQTYPNAAAPTAAKPDRAALEAEARRRGLIK